MTNKIVLFCLLLLAGQAVFADGLAQYEKDIRRLVPEFAGFGERSGRDINLLDKERKTVAVLRVAPEKYERIEGFDGVVNVAVVLKNDRIIGIAIGKNSETPRWIQKVRASGFMEKWNGKTLAEAEKLKVDAVTGATYTSEAVKSEVKAVVSK